MAVLRISFAGAQQCPTWNGFLPVALGFTLLSKQIAPDVFFTQSVSGHRRRSLRGKAGPLAVCLSFLIGSFTNLSSVIGDARTYPCFSIRFIYTEFEELGH